MGDFGGQRAGHQLVVRGLVLHLILIFAFFEHQPGPGERAVQHDVDFIEGQPVFHQPVECFKAGAGVAGKELHHLAVTPRAVLGHQVHRHVEVAQRHQRFDTVLFTFAEQIAIEGDTFLIRRQFIAVRVQTAPGDGGAEYAEAHFRHQRDIFFIAMIEVDRLVAGIELIIAQGETLLLAQFDRQTVDAVRDHIHGGQPFTAFKIGAFCLVGGNGAAPEESLRKCRHALPR